MNDEMRNTYRGNIIAADDSAENLQVLSRILKEAGYKVRPVLSGSQALKATIAEPPDLILLDVTMPGMDGFEVCQALKDIEELKEIPVIFISGLADITDKIQAFSAGGVDYITKPFQVKEVLARVNTHVKLSRLQKELERNNTNLQQQVLEQVREISQLQMATIFVVANLAECRDRDTGIHLERTREYCKLLATKLQESTHYSNQINASFINTIYEASPLHDIGKVGIPDSILLKPGKLLPEEFEIMKTHTLIGANALEVVRKRYPQHEFIEMGIQITRHHHEWWDGSGYPDGLAGTAIPLSARIMAIADVYDAVASKRIYKDAVSHEECCEIILSGRGSQFDPVITDTFVQNADGFMQIRDMQTAE